MELINKSDILFNELESLFPFCILFDNHSKIQHIGKSLLKLFPTLKIHSELSNQFILFRPKGESLDEESIIKLQNHLVVLQFNLDNTIMLKGQFAQLNQGKLYIFASTPWFNSTDEILTRNLSISDFAAHDATVDMLHVLKNQEIAISELRESEQRLVKQKKNLENEQRQLTLAKQEIQSSNEQLILFQSLINNSSDAIQVSYDNGRLFYINHVAAQRLGISPDDCNQYYVSDFEKIFSEERTWQDHVQELKNVEFLTIEGINKNQLNGELFPVEVTVKYIKIGENGFIVANSRDVSERKQKELQLIQQEEQYRNIIANMNIGLLEINMNSEVTYHNQCFEHMANLTDFQNQQSEIQKIISQLYNKEAITTLGIYSFEKEIFDASGNNKWWLISIASNQNDNNEKIGNIVVCMDITEQKMLEKELEEALIKAKEASAAKEAFLANMSHEIRTPLNGVIGMIREINKEPLSKKQETFLANAQKASQHLLSIINNILDLSKIEAGELKLEKFPLQIPTLLDDVRKILDSQASEKGITLTTQVVGNKDIVVLGDETRLRQILINLTGNAIKFTEVGGVRISCTISPNADHTNAEIQFEILDTGIGMDPEYVAKIFTKFQQEDLSITRKFGGSGLGMVITKELIDLMNGTMEVKSAKGNGTSTKTKISLPINQETLHTQKEEVNLDLLHNIHLLLVEDNELNRLVACNTLEPFNMHITEVENGEEAVKALQTKNFDIVLMDLQMPIMGGLEATQLVREKGINVPIIALTANAFKSEIEKCKNAGMNDYVTKPFEEKNLFTVIAKNLQKNVNIPNNKTTTMTYDLSKINSIARGKPEFVQKMLTLFVSSVEEALLNIEEAEQNKDLDLIQKSLHKIKPSVDYLSMPQTLQYIKQIEAHEGNYLDQSLIDILQIVKAQLITTKTDIKQQI